MCLFYFVVAIPLILFRLFVRLISSFNSGEFNDDVGAVRCKLCPRNTYISVTKRTTPCIECPMGWSSGKGGIEVGSTKCQVCGAGKFGDADKFGERCKKCPLGYARNGNNNDAT